MIDEGGHDPTRDAANAPADEPEDPLQHRREDGGAAALQEFEAGALPALKEVVVQIPAGLNLLVGIDEQRQRPLAELFPRSGLVSVGPRMARSRWSLFYAEGRPKRARLDIAFRQPVQMRVRVLFVLPDTVPCLRYVRDGARVCLVTRAAFAELESTRRCVRGLIQVPDAPRKNLERALADFDEE